MIICHCTATTDRDVERHLLDGHRDPEALAEACGAGAQCGACRPALAAVLGRMEAALASAPA